MMAEVREREEEMRGFCASPSRAIRAAASPLALSASSVCFRLRMGCAPEAAADLCRGALDRRRGLTRRAAAAKRSSSETQQQQRRFRGGQKRRLAEPRRVGARPRGPKATHHNTPRPRRAERTENGQIAHTPAHPTTSTHTHTNPNHTRKKNTQSQHKQGEPFIVQLGWAATCVMFSFSLSLVVWGRSGM